MKFSIVEWTEDQGSFFVTFTVASNKADRMDTYRTSFVFNGEDPQLFMNKIRNYLISHVSYIDNMKSIKSIMTGFSFTDPTVHYYDNIGVDDVT
jgi:hypothetical protein